jgi:ATP-dependent DNA helicase Rep
LYGRHHVRLLREEHVAAGLRQRFSILDATDSQALIAELLGTTDRKLVRQAAGVLGRWKNAALTPDEAADAAQDPAEVNPAEVNNMVELYRRYRQTLLAWQAVDFDDLIALPLRLLERDAEIAGRWQGRLRHVLIDEYQDTNPAQYRLLRALTGLRHAFTAVGDDDQAIYGWRGASADNLGQLARDYAQLRVIKLEQNYRSSGRILAAANALITHNPKQFEKSLWSEYGPGDPVEVLAHRDDAAEAEAVVMRLQAHRLRGGYRWMDYAILYRGNHQARLFEEALRGQQIPYRVSGGQSFFERAEIRDVCAWLRLLCNEDDDPAFIRAVTTPRRGVGPATLEKLGGLAARGRCSLFAALDRPDCHDIIPERQLELLTQFRDFIARMQERAAREPAGEVMRDLVRAIDYELYLQDSDPGRPGETRWANVCDFMDWVARKGEDGKTLLDVAQTVALITLLEGREGETPDVVQLSTLHAAKGLEFDHVFLVGVEEGILPHRDAVDEGRLEEERRLMYVGITRARRTLWVSHCERRKRAGEWMACEPSRFIGEMGEAVKPPDRGPVTREEGAARLAAMRARLQKTGA